MEWIKIKTRHVFHEGFNKSTLWAWVRLMALVAELETLPTEKQMLSVITKNELKLLSNHFESVGKVISIVLQKVLEDVSRVQSERNRLKQYRASTGSKDESRTRTVHSTQHSSVHVRVDKSRVEKSIKDNILNKEEPAAKAATPQAKFIKSFSDLYFEETKAPYKADSKDYILIAKLLKDYGEPALLSKAKILYASCRGRSAWFTKNGISDFTIGNLSRNWNGIVEGVQNELNKSGYTVGVNRSELERMLNERGE